MGKSAAAAGAKTDDAAKEAAAKTTEAKADEAAAAAAGEGKEKTDEKPVKSEKTYTKAELEAEKVKAIADAKKKFEDEKDLTELERIKKENEELREANRLRDAKDSVVEALTKAGARSPELIWKAVKGDLEFDDKGNLKNLDTLVTGVKTDYADQFGEAKPDGGIDGGKGSGVTGTKLTQEAIEKMTPAEINANWDEVQKVLSAPKG